MAQLAETPRRRDQAHPIDSAAPDATSDRELILEVRGLTKQFGGLVANRDVDFDIPRRAIVSLIGPNGAGKTTFFNQLTGLYEPTSGSIAFDGTDLIGLAPHTIAELGMARTYQNIRLFQNMTVLANVLVGHHVRMKAQWWHAILGVRSVRAEEGGARALAYEMLELAGVARRYAHDPAKKLPYGDQRRAGKAPA